MKQKNLIGLTLPALLCTLLWGSAFPAVKSGYALFGIGDEAARRAETESCLESVQKCAVCCIIARKLCKIQGFVIKYSHDR